MPCQYETFGDDTAYQKLKEDNDRLTKLFCKAGKIIHTMVAPGPRTVVPPDEMAEVMAAWRAHRREDKARAVRHVEGQVRKVQADLVARIVCDHPHVSDMKTIEQLGGETNKLRARLEKLQIELQEIADSDPTTTDLY